MFLTRSTPLARAVLLFATGLSLASGAAAQTLQALPVSLQETVEDAVAVTDGDPDAVRLSAANGLLDISGKMSGFDGRTYIIETALGAVAVPADAVRCEGQGCPPASDVVASLAVAGTPRVVSMLVPDLIDSYSLHLDTDIRRAVSASGNVLYQLVSYDGDTVVDAELVDRDPEQAVTDLVEGRAMLALLPRALTEAEAERMIPLGRAALVSQRLEQAVALDALSVHVGPGAGVPALSPNALADILTGRITNWSTLGGADMPITIFTRPEGTDVRAMIDDFVLGHSGATMAATVIPLDTDGQIRATVAAFPNGIGIARRDSTDEETEYAALPIIDRCGVPVPPTDEALKSGRYPLAGPVYAYSAPGIGSNHGQSLIAFAASEAGQETMRFAGYVDLMPEEMPAAAGGPEGAARLTTTFHMDASGDRLDARGRADLGQLADRLSRGATDGSEVILLVRGASEAPARTVLAQLFAEHPDIEDRVEVAFRVAATTQPPIGCPPQALVAPIVEVWTRPLSQG